MNAWELLQNKQSWLNCSEQNSSLKRKINRWESICLVFWTTLCGDRATQSKQLRVSFWAWAVAQVRRDPDEDQPAFDMIVFVSGREPKSHKIQHCDTPNTTTYQNMCVIHGHGRRVHAVRWGRQIQFWLSISVEITRPHRSHVYVFSVSETTHCWTTVSKTDGRVLCGCDEQQITTCAWLTNYRSFHMQLSPCWRRRCLAAESIVVSSMQFKE